MKRIVLYGIGSPLIVDAEEACARAGIKIVAGVRNVDARDWVSSAVRIVPSDAVTDELRRYPIVVAMFTPGHRQRAFEAAVADGFAQAATLIDPTSVLARSAEFGSGVFVNAGCVIGGACRIGDRVLINRSASLGHHAQLADYVSIGPGVVLAGAVTVGRGATICAGAVVLPEVSIGENAVIAAGCVVRESVAPRTLVGGNPGRVLRPAIAGYNDLTV
jgi:sugar O-acyltransferase (sialic acid O-acetyltransferase NeuD family)